MCGRWWEGLIGDKCVVGRIFTVVDEIDSGIAYHKYD